MEEAGVAQGLDSSPAGRKFEETNEMSLGDGTITLVTGYTGIVGRGIVNALISHTKTTVVAIVRSVTSATVETESSRYGSPSRLLIVPGIEEDGTMLKLPERIVGAIGDRKIDHVVSCFGGQAPRKLLSSMDDGDVLASAERSLPHLRLLKAVLPLVDAENPTSSYTFVTGMLGERCFMPDKLTGMTLSNSILYGMIVAFRSELQAAGSAINVRELRIGSMLHAPCNDKGGPVESGHPTMPTYTDLKSFSSELVGRFLIDEIERGSEDHIVRLRDQEFREYSDERTV